MSYHFVHRKHLRRQSRCTCGAAVGAKDEEGANRTVTTIIGLSIVIGVVLCVGGIAFIEPLMWVFGDSDASLCPRSTPSGCLWRPWPICLPRA